MVRRHVVKWALALSLCTGLGCASNNTLVDSFETLTNETQKAGFFKVPQKLIAAVNGLPDAPACESL